MKIIGLYVVAHTVSIKQGPKVEGYVWFLANMHCSAATRPCSHALSIAMLPCCHELIRCPRVKFKYLSLVGEPRKWPETMTWSYQEEGPVSPRQWLFRGAFFSEATVGHLLGKHIYTQLSRCCHVLNTPR